MTLVRSWSLFAFILMVSLCSLFTLFHVTHNTKQYTEEGGQIIFIDVGNSDSIFLKLGNRNILMDGGNDNSVSIYFSYFNFIDSCFFSDVLLTHPHKDHLFGLIKLLKSCRVSKLYFNAVDFDSNLYRDFLNLLDTKIDDLIPYSLYAGDTININNIFLHVVWPPKNFEDENINNHSIVILLDYFDFEVLFLGDLEYLFQENLLDDSHIKNIDLPLEIIKVPHQGSKDALNKNFVEFLKPQIAIFSVGENTYGHPNESVINFYKGMGSKILRTDEQGTIVINVPQMPSEQ